ncbi:MAG: glycosyl hydrolase 115 family protein [Sporolactobacillus sp.]|jgi:hypothetical protein|nr:glycosyl hydrolase 115 family protein [Sporolactobacillus sp.]
MSDEKFIFNRNTRLMIEGNLTLPIVHALNVLKRDIEKVLTPSKLYAGDRIVIRYAPDADRAAQAPETFAIVFAGGAGKRTLTVTGHDELGVIYGLLYLSCKHLGVQPFWFFNDLEPAPQDKVEIEPTSYASKPFKVRYRGWFVNDEVLINGWKTGAAAKKVWAIIYETLLRCGGNMIIPGTDTKALANRNAAVEWGLYITHHHAEPLGAEMFLRVYPDQEASYAVHPDLFKKIWQQAVIAQRDKKVVWNIGFRGQGDAAFWHDDPRFKTDAARGRLISRIMRIQMDIVKKYIRHPVFCTNIYGEIMGLYDRGVIDVPDGVIKIWANNGYGKMVSRRQGNDNPRVPALPTAKDKPGNGIYYHVSFHDLQASSHLTMLPNSPEFVAFEIGNAFVSGADDYLVVNSGNIKPHTYTLGVIHELWRRGTIDVARYRTDYVRTYYSSNQEKIAESYAHYFTNQIQYGKHEDEKAGEEFYNYLTREIICHWMRGAKPTDTLESLLWATGRIPFSEQVKWFKEKCQYGVRSWGHYRWEVEQIFNSIDNAGDKQLFYDSVVLQSIIHDTGSRGAVKVCEAYEAYLQKNLFKAYMIAQEGLRQFRAGDQAMRAAEHDKWQGFYRNDCLVNLKLTAYTIDSLRRYLRVLGDGPVFNEWEKQQLFSANDRQIGLQTAYFNQLSDDELYERIREKSSRERAAKEHSPSVKGKGES